MDNRYDVIIIGGGVCGAAVAYFCSKYKLKSAILEKENDVSCGTSRANSAIIHAGYDPAPGTLMAKLNVRGSFLTKEICEKTDVPYKRIGSLVIAFGKEDDEHVKRLYERGKENGVPELEILSGEQVREKEPNLSEEVTSALYAGTAAIISPWEFTLALAETAVQNGCDFIRDAEVTGIDRDEDGFYTVHSAKGDFITRYVVNAAGVFADKVHNMAAKPEFEISPSAGQYYLLDKSEGDRAKHVVFQCPNKNGKGVLVAPTVHGNLIVGPNSEPVTGDDTKTTAEGLATVKEKALRSIPSVNFAESIRNFSGVRAKSGGDFIIKEAEDAPGFIDVAGICSPGLSAAAAIGEYVVEIIKKINPESLEENKYFICERKRTRFSELSPEEKKKLAKENPAFARVICRCETVTEGEILESLSTPIPPVSVDGVKRRVNAGMGRCQGGFCGPRVVEILAKSQGVPMNKILKDRAGSDILFEETKGGRNDE